ncbi:MAG: prepilin-type N-terminal cleavage/methylation domain-containing protein [bacterium]
MHSYWTKNNNGKSKRGYTLMEALVAIAIIMVAVASPITIAQKGLNSAVYSKNQLIASYLAQDAIEYVKNLRDQNILKGNVWYTGFAGICGKDATNNDCQIDTLKDYFTNPANSATPAIFTFGTIGTVLKIDDNGFYGYYNPSGTATKFVRKIHMEGIAFSGALAPVDEVWMVVTVSWGDINDPADKNKVEVRTSLYNY